MAEVSISVGGRAYSVACDDGQEERVASLAARIDAEAAAFASGGVISEARLLLMSALMVADKLDEAEAKAAAAPARPAAAPVPQAADAVAPDLFGDASAGDAHAEVAEAVEAIDAAVARLEALTAMREGGDDPGLMETAKTAANAADEYGAEADEAQAADREPGGATAQGTGEEGDDDEPKPMTRDEMRALRRERRRLAAERTQEENSG